MRNCLIFIFALLLLSACTQPANILVIPKDKQGGYCVAKADYNSWGGDKAITLLDKNNNAITCTGKHRLIEQKSFSCADKKYNVQLTCFHGTTVDLTYTLKESCTEAYGTAIVDTGKEYEVYMGISDDLMKSKIDEYEKSISK